MGSADLASSWAIEALNIPKSALEFLAKAETPESAVTRWTHLRPLLKSCWRQKSQDTHPDKGGTDEDFQLVQRAWEIIQQELFAVAYWHAKHEQPSNELATSDIFSFRDPPFLRR